MTWDEVCETTPLIAILRVVTPAEAADVAGALYEGGLRCVEVTLNSPEPLASLAAIGAALGERMLVGAGTVLTAAEVAEVARAGGRLIVSPNIDARVIAATRAAGLTSLPAVFTPTEAFAALEAGAHALKLFPAEAASPAGLKAMRAVLPPATRLFPVGGIEAPAIAAWRAAGAAGLGVGSALYATGRPVGEIRERASEFMAAWRAAGRPAQLG